MGFRKHRQILGSKIGTVLGVLMVTASWLSPPARAQAKYPNETITVGPPIVCQIIWPRPNMVFSENARVPLEYFIEDYDDTVIRSADQAVSRKNRIRRHANMSQGDISAQWSVIPDTAGSFIVGGTIFVPAPLPQGTNSRMVTLRLTCNDLGTIGDDRWASDPAITQDVSITINKDPSVDHMRVFFTDPGGVVSEPPVTSGRVAAERVRLWTDVAVSPEPPGSWEAISYTWTTPWGNPTGNPATSNEIPETAAHQVYNVSCTVRFRRFVDGVEWRGRCGSQRRLRDVRPSLRGVDGHQPRRQRLPGGQPGRRRLRPRGTTADTVSVKPIR